MDAHRNPRKARKSAQEQDRRRRRNERDRAWRAAETVEQRSERLRKRRERNCARRAAQTASERQATSQQRSTHERKRMAAETPEEKEDYSVWALTSTKGWQLKSRRKKITADENQPARKFGSWKPRGERERSQRMSTNQHERLAVESPEKITADEHQQYERLTVECTWYLMKVFIPSVTIYFLNCNIMWRLLLLLFM